MNKSASAVQEGCGSAAAPERGPIGTGSGRPLRVLIVEDSEVDFELLELALARASYDVTAERVEDEPAMRRALQTHSWDVVISDHHLPRFSATAALSTLQSCGLDIPFLIVSGAIGEDAAVEAMLAGADDYVMKSRLARLAPAIERSIRAAEARRERRLAEERLREREARLRALTQHLETVKEDERARIAREIHDDIGGTLTGLKADVAWLRKRFAGDAQVLEKLGSMTELLDSAVHASVRIARDLRPPVLDLGFVPAIQWQAQDFQKRTGVKCIVECDDEDLVVAPRRATAAFRIFQELLTNVTKHADASIVRVRIVAEGDALGLQVQDNGRGMAEGDRSKHGSYGISGMFERARELDGRFEVGAAPEGGTRATLWLPLEENES